MGRKRIVSFATLLVFLCAARSFAQTDAYTRMYGMSSRSAAMGGAMVGIAEGIDALAYNPAALALTKNSFSLQLQYFPVSDLKVNDTQCGPSGFGALAGLTQKALRDRIGFGFEFMPQSGGGGGGGSGTYSWPTFGGPGLLSIQGGGVGIGPVNLALALKLHDTLAIGVMPTSNIWIRTSPIEIGLGQLLQTILGAGAGSPATDINPNIGLGLSLEDTKYSFSVAWRPIKYLSLGYETIPITKIRLRIPIVINGGGVIDDIRELIMADILDTPPIQQYGVGVNIPFNSTNKLTLAWSQQILGFKTLYDELYGDYLKYSDPVLTNAISISGVGAPTKVNNAVVNRYGAEYLLGLKGLKGVPKALDRRNAVVAIRGGYFDWNSPYPSTLHGHTFDNDLQVYSGGFGLSFDRAGKSSLDKPLTDHSFSVDMHVQYINVDTKDYKLMYDYWGNPLSSGDLYHFHTGGQIWVVGLELSWLH